MAEDPLLRRFVKHVENVLLKKEKQSSYDVCAQTGADIVVNTDLESESENGQYIYGLNSSWPKENEEIPFVEPNDDDAFITSVQNGNETDVSIESIDGDDEYAFEETEDEHVFAFEEAVDVQEEEEDSGPKKVTWYKWHAA